MDELTRMGADIKVESNVAIINGVDHYMGARVSAPDLRAGAALVIAGLAAEGITVIDDGTCLDLDREPALYIKSVV